MSSGDLQSGLMIDAEGSHLYGRDSLRLRKRGQDLRFGFAPFQNNSQSETETLVVQKAEQ